MGRLLRWLRVADARAVGQAMLVAMLALWLVGEVVSLLGFARWGGGWSYYMAFHPQGYGIKRYPWGIATYMWWHRDFFSLGVNALCLYGLSGLYRGFDSGRGFALTFVWGSLAGAVCYALAAMLAGLWGLGSVLPLYGASAGVCALSFRLAMARPSLRLGFAGFRCNFLLLILLIYILTTLVNPTNIGGMLAHLGGAVYGVARAFADVEAEVKASLDKPQATEPSPPDATERTAIEDKLRESGYRSLSPEEQVKL